MNKGELNLRIINVKLRRVDVNRLCLLLITDRDYENNPWMKDLYQRLKEQREQFDEKLEEERVKQYCDKDVQVLEGMMKNENRRNKI